MTQMQASDAAASEPSRLRAASVAALTTAIRPVAGALGLAALTGVAYAMCSADSGAPAITKGLAECIAALGGAYTAWVACEKAGRALRDPSRASGQEWKDAAVGAAWSAGGRAKRIAKGLAYYAAGVAALHGIDAWGASGAYAKLAYAHEHATSAGSMVGYATATAVAVVGELAAGAAVAWGYLEALAVSAEMVGDPSPTEGIPGAASNVAGKIAQWREGLEKAVGKPRREPPKA